MTHPPTETPEPWQRIVGDVRGEPGPTLVCIGGIHGNEPAGLVAAQAVLEKLLRAHASGKGELRGRLFVIAGNLEALNTGDPAMRYFDTDLNRMFGPDTIEHARATPTADRNHEQKQLLELLDLLQETAADAPGGSALMDLHTFSSKSPPFSYVEDSLPARWAGLALGLPLIVGLEEELQGLLADYATSRLGLLALVIEAGTHDDPESQRIHEAALWVMLRTLGMIDDPDTLAGFDVHARLRAAAGEQAGRFFDIRQRVTVGDPPMDMLDRAQAFTHVWKGLTRVASRETPSGQELIRSPADGILFMPNRQQRKRPADDAFFILRPIWRPFIGVSGWLRGQAWAHRLLALLPGVRPDPADPHTLRVDHDVAALMARDILHLFGYRVHTSCPARYHRPLTRLLIALWVMPRAVLRLAGLLPTDHDEIWVVRRRRLDVEPTDPAPVARLDEPPPRPVSA